MLRRLMFASLMCAACGDGLCLMGVDPAANPKLAAICAPVAAAKKDGGALTVQPDGGAADLEHHAASRDPYEDKPATPPPQPPPPPPQRPAPAPVRGKTAPA